MPGLALHALEVEDLTSDTGGPGFGWEIRNAHTRLRAATRPHKKGNDVVFEGGGGRAGKATKSSRKFRNDLSRADGENMAVSYCAQQKREPVNVLTPVRMVQKGQRTPGRPVLRTRLLRRGLRPPRAGDGAGASLTLSGSVTGHRDSVIITGSLLRALGSHAFSVALFT